MVVLLACRLRLGLVLLRTHPAPACLPVADLGVGISLSLHFTRLKYYKFRYL